MINISSKKVLLLFLFIIFSFALKAQTNVSGFISANTTWDLAGSPYIVVSNALVSQGVTLTINPGVVVKLDSACALQVDGEMIAVGTEANRITFTSNKAIPKPGDWAELHFSNFAVSAVFDNAGNYLSGCIMKYCDVLYGGTLNSQYGEIHIESSSPYFSRCNFNYSAQAGVYCNGSSCLVDSSAIDSCVGYGIEFLSVALNSCGVIIRSDTIKYCGGGINTNDNSQCTTIIDNNYFISNSPDKAILASVHIGEIIDNYFINNNSVYSSSGLVNISGDSLLISGNSFINNMDSDLQRTNSTLAYISGNSMISDNSFINNSVNASSESGSPEGIIFVTGGIDTIECNLFLNNTILYGSDQGSGCINVQSSSSVVISNNVFDDNVFNDPVYFGASVAWIDGGTPTTFTTFANNTIRNNLASLFACCVFYPFLNTNNQLLHIGQNNFINNVSQDIIYISGGASNATYNFLYMRNNNFNDPAAKYELYNNIPYGSPDLYPDSNYWGNTSTQHIDSVIFDYFDNENQSVVYYEPILTAPVVIDTTCSGGIPTGIINVDQTNSKAFPNPFSTSTEVMFGKELRDAEVRIYNVFGQQIRVVEHLNGDRVIIERGNLCSGVYIYEVLDKEGRVGEGKLVVE